MECWDLNSKWLVDKFHFSTHVGALIKQDCRVFPDAYNLVTVPVSQSSHATMFLYANYIQISSVRGMSSLEGDRGSGQQEGCCSQTFDGLCELAEAGAVLQGGE